MKFNEEYSEALKASAKNTSEIIINAMEFDFNNFPSINSMKNTCSEAAKLLYTAIVDIIEDQNSISKYVRSISYEMGTKSIIEGFASAFKEYCAIVGYYPDKVDTAAVNAIINCVVACNMLYKQFSLYVGANDAYLNIFTSNESSGTRVSE